MMDNGTLSIEEESKVIGELLAEVETDNARESWASGRLSDLHYPTGGACGAATCDRPGCLMCDTEGRDD